MAYFSTYKSNQLVPVIIAVTTNLAHVDYAIITVHQFRLHANIYVRYILSFFFGKKGVASLILRAHTHPTTLVVFLC